jgi:hypothetical protein
MITRARNFKDESVEELVQRFTEIALKQYDALLDNNTRWYNQLFDQMNLVREELRSRPGDQRWALVRLFDHPNAQVRVKAAKSTLVLVPDQARAVLQNVADSNKGYQSLDAGMCLTNLDRGIFKPT